MLNIGISSQLALSTIFGESLGGMWALINTLQLLNYVSIFTLFFPEIVLTLFSYITIVNMENQYFSNAYLLHIDESQLEDKNSWDYRFRNQGIESSSILMN